MGTQGGPLGCSPLLDYPPSSRMTAASSATDSSFAKFICDLVRVVSVQGSGHIFSRESYAAAPLERAPDVAGSLCAGGCLEPCPLCVERGLREVLPSWNVTCAMRHLVLRRKVWGGSVVSLKPFMLCESFGSQKSLKGYYAACSLWVAVTWGKTSFAWELLKGKSVFSVVRPV